MGIEKITQRITGEAEALAAEIIAKAEAEAGALLSDARAKAEVIISDAEKEGIEDKEKLVSRRKSLAVIDGRKLMLNRKQELISECFDRAVTEIVSADRKKYISFLADIVKDTGEKEGELILNRKDRDEIGAGLAALIKQEIPDSDIRLSEETGDIKGGLLLRKGSVYINGTVEALVEEKKAELTGEVADLLFG